MSWQPKTTGSLISQLMREQNKLRDAVYRQNFGTISHTGLGSLGGFGDSVGAGHGGINYKPETQIVSNIKFDDTVDSTDGYSHIRPTNTLIICFNVF